VGLIVWPVVESPRSPLPVDAERIRTSTWLSMVPFGGHQRRWSMWPCHRHRVGHREETKTKRVTSASIIMKQYQAAFTCWAGPSGLRWWEIRLKRIYNLWCSKLVYTPFALSFVTLRGIFMHFSELTY
jgi:hypothetical protein